MVLRDWWLPPWISPDEVFSERHMIDGPAPYEHAAPTPEGIEKLAAGLRERRAEHLLTRPIATFIDSLDRVARRWLDPTLPERKAVVPSIASRSGFSRQMAEHVLDLEQISSLGPDLALALERDLGDPKALDGFVDVPFLRGRTHAIGPGLVGGVCSSNIPGLPHLTVLRSLLVKSACLLRSSRDEPVFLPCYLETIAREDPGLGMCTAALCWNPHDREAESAFLSAIDHLVVYGSDAAITALRSRARPGLRGSWHGHRVGIAVVLRSALDTGDVGTLARNLAYDFTAYDQYACITPQVLYVEDGAAVTPVALAGHLAEAMRALRDPFPPRTRDASTLAVLRARLADLELREACGEPIRVVSADLDGPVIVQPLSSFEPGLLDRFVPVLPVAHWREVIAHVSRAPGLLQNAAIAGVGGDAETLKVELARAGCSRVCPPGHMSLPSMMWHHDGLPRLGELVRWCDEETHHVEIGATGARWAQLSS